MAVREGTRAYTQVRYYNGVIVPHLTLIRVLGPNELSYKFLMLALVTMKVGMYVQGNVTNKP